MAEPANNPDPDHEASILAVRHGLATPEQIQECSRRQKLLASRGVNPVPTLGQILVEKAIVTAEQLASLRGAAAHDPTAGAIAAAPPPQGPALSGVEGEAFGKYVKVERLGAGGMGEVWKARDTQLGRWVALKFPRHDDPGDLARFRREAETAARLKHPNIVTIFEVGEQDGKAYISMQYVEGKTLAAFPRDDRRLLVRFVRDAAAAVHAAHEQGVIHRDLKPANLMVEADRVVVMDFGLAKAMKLGKSLSLSGSIVGTPPYMSPEQVEGSAHKVTAASDVYSLGATLYDLLADRPPFQAPDLYRLLKQIVEEKPPPLRRINPAVDAALEAIVMKCLEKNPASRYATALALAEDLTRYLEGKAILPSLASRHEAPASRRPPLPVRPPPPAVRTQEEVNREPARWPKVTFIIVALLAAAGLTLFAVLNRTPRADETPSVGGPPPGTGGGETKDGKSGDDKREPPTGKKKGVASIGAQAKASAARMIAEAEACVTRAIAKRAAKDFAGSVAECARALELWDGCPEAYYRRGLALEDLGNRGGAIADFSRAIALRNDFEEAYASRGSAKFDEGDLRGALADLDRAVALKDDDVEARYGRALVHRGLGNADGALADLNRVIELRKDDPQFYSDRGVIKVMKEDLDGAIADFSRAIDLKKDFAAAWFNRGLAKSRKADLDGAIEDFDRAVKINVDYSEAYFHRALVKERKGDLGGAMVDYSQALVAKRDYWQAYVNRGIIAQEWKDFKGAIMDFEKALKLAPPDWPGREGIQKRLEECRRK